MEAVCTEDTTVRVAADEEISSMTTQKVLLDNT